MSTISKTDVFSVSSSLVGVSHRSSAEATLPDTGDLVRAEEREPPRLDALFAVQNLGRFTDMALRPLIAWPAPSQQDERIDNLQATLRTLALADPDLAAWAGAASKVLHSDRELKRLLRLYKEALIAC